MVTCLTFGFALSKMCPYEELMPILLMAAYVGFHGVLAVTTCILPSISAQMLGFGFLKCGVPGMLFSSIATNTFARLVKSAEASVCPEVDFTEPMSRGVGRFLQ